MSIIFATNNKKKLEQIKALVGPEINVLGLSDVGVKIDVEEDGKTFEENAVKKAKEVFFYVNKIENSVDNNGSNNKNYENNYKTCAKACKTCDDEVKNCSRDIKSYGECVKNKELLSKKLKDNGKYGCEKFEVLSDDSGICIDFFDGWPGVYTHRFLPHSSPEERNDYIIEKMQNVDDDLRGAKNVCTLAFVDENGNEHVFEGVVRGKIAHKQRGDNLFGFDPIFELENGKTLAQLTSDEKIKVNARSLAFKKFLDFYKSN